MKRAKFQSMWLIRLQDCLFAVIFIQLDFVIHFCWLKAAVSTFLTFMLFSQLRVTLWYMIVKITGEWACWLWWWRCSSFGFILVLFMLYLWWWCCLMCVSQQVISIFGDILLSVLSNVFSMHLILVPIHVIPIRYKNLNLISDLPDWIPEFLCEKLIYSNKQYCTKNPF